MDKMTGHVTHKNEQDENLDHDNQGSYDIGRMHIADNNLDIGSRIRERKKEARSIRAVRTLGPNRPSKQFPSKRWFEACFVRYLTESSNNCMVEYGKNAIPEYPREESGLYKAILQNYACKSFPHIINPNSICLPVIITL